MWLSEAAERGDVGLETGLLEYEAALLGNLALRTPGSGGADEAAPAEPDSGDDIDDLYVSLHKFGRAVEGLKRASSQPGGKGSAPENLLFGILGEIASLKEKAQIARKGEVTQFCDACAGFIQYALDNGRLQDVRIVNVLDNANITLQTVFETAGVEDNDSLESTIQLLQRPHDLLNSMPVVR
jgi:hypothetical protein